jgi:YcaO-like protein with predicted kinase domain
MIDLRPAGGHALGGRTPKAYVRGTHRTIPPSETLARLKPLLWIAGDDWLRHERVWVPFQLVHTAYTTRMRWDLVGFAVSSTGLASGNHVLEAVSHAFCEIVERDATARFAARSDEDREARRLNLRTVDDPDCCAVLERYRRARVDVAVWDVTFASVPSVESASFEEDVARLLGPAAIASWSSS